MSIRENATVPKPDILLVRFAGIGSMTCPVDPKQQKRQSGKMVAILLAGIVSGFVLRYERTESGADQSSSSRVAHPENAGEVEAPPVSPAATKLKDRKLAEGTISFSPWQWSQVLRNPGKWELSISECASGAVPVFNDVPVVSRLFQEAEPGPELIDHLMLFGWDASRRKEIRGMLTKLADEVKQVQGESAQVSYPGGGEVRIDYSSGEPRLRELTSGFEKQLVDLIGAEDAERFMVLSGVPYWKSESIEFTVSESRDGESILLTGVQFFGSVQIEGGSEAGTRLRTLQNLNVEMAPTGIDWERLLKESEGAASLAK